MPLPKVKAADALKSDDGNDSIDTFLRQAVGKEPLLSVPRSNESPVQWLQLFQALDQQDLHGWPSYAPMKFQMQKCEKCSREFCSTINYRRHMRLHRRKLNLNKDSTSKNRGLLQVFWKKLFVEEAVDIMSFDDVSLEGLAGSSITKELQSFILKPGYKSLPQSYAKAGSALLDLVQSRLSRFPISPEELFCILDDASESTFLCAGPAESLQKFVFEDDAGKIGLELRNLIACTCFIVEQKLVKAFLTDKDAEALRHHKLLVEEEEAAQKRQAAFLEKKRQKKLRQKELRVKELGSGEIDDCPEEIPRSSPTSTSIPADILDSTLEIFMNTIPSPEPAQLMNAGGDTSKEQDNGYPDFGDYQNEQDLGAYQNVEHRTLHRGGRRHVVNTRWQASKLPRHPNGFHASHNYQVQRPGSVQKHSSRDSNAAASSVKVWTPKPKTETNEERSRTRLPHEEPKLPTKHKKHEVLIGSIAVALGNRIIHEHGGNVGGGSNLSSTDKNSIFELPIECSAVKATTAKSSRPVGQLENGSQIPIHNNNSASENGSMLCNEVQQKLVKSCSNVCEVPDLSVGGEDQGGMKFSSHEAETFLSQRWKEAITADHAKLVMSPDGLPGHLQVCGENDEAIQSSKLDTCTVVCIAENSLPAQTSIDTSAAKIQTVRVNKPEKGSKVKYIPKQRRSLHET